MSASYSDKAIRDNTAHRKGDGSDHADVAANTIHRNTTGNPHGTLATDITDFDSEVSNNTSVAANTLKVSADGSVTTHNDVSSAGSGQIITTAERNDLNNATLNTDTDLSANSYFLDENNMISNDPTKVASQQSIVNYVNTQIASNNYYQGGYDAATNTPDLESPLPGAISAGDVWTITENGVFFTQSVEKGESLRALVDDPAALGDWVILGGNLSAASIKVQYESNPDTNAFTDAEKVNVATNTLKVSADLSVTTHSDVTSAGSGQIITNSERTKLDGIEANATYNPKTILSSSYNNETLDTPDNLIRFRLTPSHDLEVRTVSGTASYDYGLHEFGIGTNDTQGGDGTLTTSWVNIGTLDFGSRAVTVIFGNRTAAKAYRVEVISFFSTRAYMIIEQLR